MKTKVFLKTVALSAVILFGGIAASAANKNNLIYNSEEKDGVMVGQTVYKMDGGTLANYMKHSYKYDDQKRMTESETMKWNTGKNAWKTTFAFATLIKEKLSLLLIISGITNKKHMSLFPK